MRRDYEKGFVVRSKWLGIIGILGLTSQGWALVVTPSRTEVRPDLGAKGEAASNVTERLL